MRKLSLRLDDLAVETFEATLAPPAQRGTVRGQTGQLSCGPCTGYYGDPASTCWNTCARYTDPCYNTCGGQASCAGTCDVTCGCSGADPACNGGNASAANPASTCVGFCHQTE